jgi:glycosyltransferase involved in cell wall biosynthesis
MNTVPFVSVIMPVFNEEHYIERNLRDVFRQDYPADRWELIVADGMSTDRTREIVQMLQTEQPRLRLIDNPQRIVPTGLNRAIGCARGEVIVRLDGHCEYPHDYVRQMVQLREETGADNVGGVLEPVGTSYIQRAVAAAYSCPGGLGGAALKAANGAATVREVDAVHGGCWRRERLLAVGGFDEEMVRNQDDELSFRLRKSGGRICQSLAIRVRYHVRSSLRKLFQQFAQYGYWKVRVVRKHPRQASVRHFVPTALVVVLMVGALLAPFSWWARVGWIGVTAGYGFAVAVAALAHAWSREKKLWPGIVAAVVLMHLGYGVGFLLGWVRAWLGSLPTDAIFERSTR